MEFFNQAIDILKILVMALGAGLAVWGVINLLEGYGSDNPAAKSQGIKQLMAGGGVVLIGLQLIPLLSATRASRISISTARNGLFFLILTRRLSPVRTSRRYEKCATLLQGQGLRRWSARKKSALR